MSAIELENLMRGLAARAGQLLEVVMVSVGFNLAVYAASLYAVHTVKTARTLLDYTVALYIIASALVMAAKGAEMLHRKFGEYAAMELASEKANPQALQNPSVHVSAQSRSSVMVINILAVLTLAGLIIIVAGYQIIRQASAPEAAACILPPLLIAAYAGWVWANAAK